MYMSNADIVREYREAKNKKAQIEILADQNCCKSDEIIEVLKNNGVSGKELPRQRKKKEEPEPVPVQQQESEPVKEVANDPEHRPSMQDAIDMLMSLSKSINEEIGRKQKASDNISTAAELLKEAQEIIDHENKSKETA